jgi:hypothetical protein
MTGTAKHFVICIENGDHTGALELRKVYEVVEDAAAEKKNYVRVIDESGDDYLYPTAWFVPVAVPENVEQLLHDLANK